MTPTYYPSVSYPTILEGMIDGPVRCESLDGSELYLPAGSVGVDAQGTPIVTPGTMISRLRMVYPFEQGGRVYGVSHLQKKAKRGWLKVSPSAYHWFWFWKPQSQGPQGNWIPGTEKGVYFRKPFSWRWDIAGTVQDGQLRHWIWSNGYAGTHWD